jgi:hypothetical protein
MPLHPDSTLKRPTAKQLATFQLDRVGADTVHTYLEKGFSLAICCRDCARLEEWTPPELLERFAAKLQTPIAAIAERLSCKGEGGCKSTDVAVFPHLYDQPWTWPKSSFDA